MGFPIYTPPGGGYRDTAGAFDWEKWEARGSKQTELPWSDNGTGYVGDVPPTDIDDSIVIDVDANGTQIPEPSYDRGKASELLCCPNCYHDKYLDKSPFNVGDTICLICGCVFIELTGETCTFDHDVHAKWMGKLEENNG
jgi:hypothetical protein